MEHSVFFANGSINVGEALSNQPDDVPVYKHGRQKGLFRGVNTWDDWHLIPTSRPEIVPPEVYTNYVDLPGAHGKLDLSEYLTGGPVYKNRTGSLEFYAANGYHFWAETYNQMCNFLHGNKCIMVLDDEPEYFYIGRFRVQKWNSDGSTNWSTVTVDYELEPFKFILPRASFDEYWDRFLFEDIHGYKFVNKVNASQNPKISIPGYTHGFMMDAFVDSESTFPASATITIGESDHTLTVSRSSRDAHTVKSGSLDPLTNSYDTISITGTGLIDLVFWGGSL